MLWLHLAIIFLLCYSSQSYIFSDFHLILVESIPGSIKGFIVEFCQTISVSSQYLITEEVAFLKLAAKCPADFIPPHWQWLDLVKDRGKTKKNYL